MPSEAQPKVGAAADISHAALVAREAAERLVTAALLAMRETERPALTPASAEVQRLAHDAWQAARAAREAAEALTGAAQRQVGALVRAAQDAEVTP